MFMLIVINQYERGVEYRWGRYTRTLEPGAYRSWAFSGRRVVRVDTRQDSLQITGQEILTADQIPVGLNLLVSYRVVDPEKALHEVANYLDALHQATQLAARESVGARDLESVLAEREQMSDEITEVARAAAQEFGVEVMRAHVKDVTLDGEVKAAHLAKLVADQRGQADLVAARHQVAAARARANAAKIVADNPAILAQRQLDVLEKAAENGGNQFVVVPQSVADLLGKLTGQ